MVAGPNGSGKTTLTEWLRRQNVEFGEYINPDEIARELDGSYDARVLQAQAIADQRREACIEAKRSLSFETVMSHPSKVDILLRAKAAGFFIQVFFVGTDDPRTNVERVSNRVAQGGHDVPQDRIIARWHRTMKLLHEAILAADQTFVFDNSAFDRIDISPRLVFKSSKSADENPMRYQLSPPVPDWVRHHVLDPLELKLFTSQK
jgi:predicted ABC-type ATPase